MSDQPIKICIVSVHAYPVINPNAPGTFGGIETRCWCFAKELARLPATKVTVVVNHRSAPPHSVIDGIEVIEATSRIEWFHQDLSKARQQWRKSRQIPWRQLPSLAGKLLAWTVTRPFRNASHRRWQIPSPWLTDIDADVYVAFGVNSQSDWTMISAHSIGRPFVCCLASDFDVDQRFLDQSDFANEYGVTSTLANHVIGQADGVVAQDKFQSEQLKRAWGRDSVLIQNPLDLAQWDADRSATSPDEIPREPFVLWVGRADRFHKRPLLMLEAIRASPQIPFVMILNPNDPEVEAQIKQAQLQNLTIVPQIPFRQMSALMSRASVFASTSSAAHEGMSNVLLQAAASRVPIVSLEISAEWLETSGSGICLNGDLAAFNATIARFAIDRETPEVQKFADSGRSSIEHGHDSVQQATRLLAYLREVDWHSQWHTSAKLLPCEDQ